MEVLGSPQGGRERVVAFVYWIGMLFMAGLLIDRWFDDDMGPDHPAYALLVTTWTFFLTPGVAIPAVVLVMRLLPRHWFRVPAGERVLHRMLGVGNFGWLLERSGWNRHVVAPLRRFDGTRAGLLSLERSALGGIIAHGACFAVHLLFAPPHFSPGTRGAHCGYCCPVWSCIFTRCCCSAPSCFDSSLS